MTTGYDAKYYHDIGTIAMAMEEGVRALNRIANCMEAAEKRARAVEPTTPEDIAQLMQAAQAVKRGFADMEEAVRKEREE